MNDQHAQLVLAAIIALPAAATARIHAQGTQPVDLTTWTAESYPAVSGFDPGVWTVAADGLSVYQSVNGQPTLFYSDFNAFNTSFRGVARVETSRDDDFFGFALGFQPGDATNPNADYLLVDWKMSNQFFDFGSPSCTPGSTAAAGLAVSRAIGIPTADEFWGHVNFDTPACSDLNSGLAELQRGLVSGSTGWGDFVEYEFQFDFTATSLKVFVDGVLELDISGSFADGRIAFYNFSQACVRYSGFTVTPLGACCNEMAMTCEDGITEEDCLNVGGQWFADMICSDLDGDDDGFPACAGDCDDSDPGVYPGAEEVCNGVDDNCNGEIDEGGVCPSETALDIKPGSCPNSFNRGNNGRLPVALLGTTTFDVTMVDLATVRLSRADGVGGEVAPNDGPPGPPLVFEDVGTPFDGEPCDCHELGGDGIMDLSTKFDTDEVVEVLELSDLPGGSLVELVVDGFLVDGTFFTAHDCIRLVPPVGHLIPAHEQGLLPPPEFLGR